MTETKIARSRRNHESLGAIEEYGQWFGRCSCGHRSVPMLSAETAESHTSTHIGAAREYELRFGNVSA